MLITDLHVAGLGSGALLATAAIEHPDVVRFVRSTPRGERPMLAAACAHQFVAEPLDADAVVAQVARAFALREGLAAPELRAIVGTHDGDPDAAGPLHGGRQRIAASACLDPAHRRARLGRSGHGGQSAAAGELAVFRLPDAHQRSRAGRPAAGPGNRPGPGAVDARLRDVPSTDTWRAEHGASVAARRHRLGPGGQPGAGRRRSEMSCRTRGRRACCTTSASCCW